MKKRLRSLFAIIGIWFLISWALAAVVLEKGFARRDSVPEFERSYAEMIEDTIPHKELTFVSGKNRLTGRLYDGTLQEEEPGLIVVVHGLGGGASSHLPEITTFAKNGYAVFAYDGTGTRSSEGKGVRSLSQAAFDLDAALSFLQEDGIAGDVPLFVYGHSAGGYAAAVNSQIHPEIDGVICISAFERPLSEMMAQAKKRAWYFAYLGYPGLSLQYHILFGMDANRSAADALMSSGTPALIITGSQDDVVPYPVSLYASGRQADLFNATFLMVDAPYRSGHTGLWLSEEACLERKRSQKDRSADILRCNEVDEAFMDRIFSFIAQTKVVRSD